MDKKKVLYISLLFIITVIVSITYFSYAFFTSKEEYHGKINVVAGTLDYKIESNDLTNNTITLNSNETKKIEVEITSLNEIVSKYELYYQTNNNEIEVGYASDTIDSPSGEIGIKASKKVTVVIKNKTDNSATISFGVQGGLVHNQIALDTGKNSINTELSICSYNTGEVVVDEGSTGTISSLIAECEGTYKIEAWGASGGGAQYGYGGYSTGNIILNKDDTIYYAVGGQGGLPTAGYNGGGLGSTICGGGGGATHVALDSGLLSELSAHKDDGRILIVAAGGGGSWNYSGRVAGSGGGYVGVAGTGDSAGAAGTQSAAGRYGGSFGQGGNNTLENFHVSGGGAGFYGGGAGYVSGSSQSGAGGGGSSYIASSNLTDKVMLCYGCSEDLTNINTFTVNTKGTSTAGASYRDKINCPNGYSSDPISKCAKDGDGHIRITYLGTRTVTFNANGGTVSETERIVNYGNSIGELPIPTRGTDYFEGWYLEDTFTTKVDSTYVPTENVTLYAKYFTCSIISGTVVKETGTVGEDSFQTLCAGKYKLETWGAQGGSVSNIGGYGGYSVGYIDVENDEPLILYINVGETGNTGTGCGTVSRSATTNYNGGGRGNPAGGGATHIALRSGTLASLSAYKGNLINNSYYESEDILVVAGGGGGGTCAGNGGHAGGFKGSTAPTSGGYASYGYGGTQTAGGAAGRYTTGTGGSFGTGGSYTNDAAGGGGGFFGGGAGSDPGPWTAIGGGGGGSSYIASSSLVQNTSSNIINKMYCYSCEESTDLKLYTINTYGTTNNSSERDTTNCPNGYNSDPVAKCAKAGNGYARITYIGN